MLLSRIALINRELHWPFYLIIIFGRTDHPSYSTHYLYSIVYDQVQAEEAITNWVVDLFDCQYLL